MIPRVTIRPNLPSPTVELFGECHELILGRMVNVSPILR